MSIEEIAEKEYPLSGGKYPTTYTYDQVQLEKRKAFIKGYYA